MYIYTYIMIYIYTSSKTMIGLAKGCPTTNIFAQSVALGQAAQALGSANLRCGVYQSLSWADPNGLGLQNGFVKKLVERRITNTFCPFHFIIFHRYPPILQVKHIQKLQSRNGSISSIWISKYFWQAWSKKNEIAEQNSVLWQCQKRGISTIL